MSVVNYLEIKRLYLAVISYKNKNGEECKEQILFEDVSKDFAVVPKEIILDLIDEFLKNREIISGTPVKCDLHWLGNKCSYVAFGSEAEVRKSAVSVQEGMNILKNFSEDEGGSKLLN